MNLEKAIEWAEERSSEYVDYHVTPWNDKYAVMSDVELSRHPDSTIVYNTKDKIINYKLISKLNSIKNDNLIYICIKSYIGGPCDGELLELHKDHYKFINEFGIEVKLHKDIIENDDRFIEYKNISRKSKLNGRLGKLFT